MGRQQDGSFFLPPASRRRRDVGEDKGYKPIDPDSETRKETNDE